jgi:hypothetical protein
MTITLKSVWGRVQRPWGYEVRVDFDGDDGRIHNEVLTFPSQPSEDDLNARVASLQSVVETRLATVVPEPVDPVVALQEQVNTLTEQVSTLTVEKEALVAENASLVSQLLEVM